MPESSKNCYSRKEVVEGRYKLIMIASGMVMVLMLHRDGHLDCRTGMVTPSEAGEAFEKMVKGKEVPESALAAFRAIVRGVSEGKEAVA